MQIKQRQQCNVSHDYVYTVYYRLSAFCYLHFSKNMLKPEKTPLPDENVHVSVSEWVGGWIYVVCSVFVIGWLSVWVRESLLQIALFCP